ncbi:MAG: hypothetical protein ACUVSU_06995 [Aggregatilineaceae bacterium]
MNPLIAGANIPLLLVVIISSLLLVLEKEARRVGAVPVPVQHER